jgi:hypothetical protein
MKRVPRLNAAPVAAAVVVVAIVEIALAVAVAAAAVAADGATATREPAPKTLDRPAPGWLSGSGCGSSSLTAPRKPTSGLVSLLLGP